MGKMEQRHAFAAAAAAAAPVAAKLPDMPYGYGELEPVIAGGKGHYIPTPQGTRYARKLAELPCLSVGGGCRDHGAAPQEAPPGLRDQLQHRPREARRRHRKPITPSLLSQEASSGSVWVLGQ